MSIVQDLSQLRARYGNDRANTILNNHGCKIVLPGISDPETADVLAKLIGRAEYSEQQVSLGADGRISRSYSTRHDAIATPDTLRQLRAGSGIVIHRDNPPALVDLPVLVQEVALSASCQGSVLPCGRPRPTLTQSAADAPASRGTPCLRMSASMSSASCSNVDVMNPLDSHNTHAICQPGHGLAAVSGGVDDVFDRSGRALQSLLYQKFQLGEHGSDS